MPCHSGWSLELRQVSVELVFWNPLSTVELSDAAANLGVDLLAVL